MRKHTAGGAGMALLRIAASGIAQGYADGVGAADVNHFLDQLQQHFPEILISSGIQQTRREDDRGECRPIRSLDRIGRSKAQAQSSNRCVQPINTLPLEPQELTKLAL